jgi:hypothetical protein
MPMAHEQAAIDRARGRRRERLIKAAALLDRVRAENPGVENIPDFPAEVRPAVRDAARAFRYDSRFGFSEVVLVLLLGAAVGGAYVMPVRAFRCEPQGEGLARCTVSERVFGLFPRDRRTIGGIAKADSSSSTHTAETHEGNGRISTSRISEESLSLFDARDQVLWSATEQRLLGASFAQLEQDIDALRSGAATQPLVRIQVCWPILMVTSLFTIAFFNTLFRHIGLALRDHELIGASLYELVFPRLGLLLPLLVCSFAWLAAFLGNDPPAFISALLVPA